MFRQLRLAVMVSFLIALHAGAALAFVYHFSWAWLSATVITWQLFALLGISVGLHRQISHRAFESTAALKLAHLTCALLAGQAGPITWASLHRTHHKHADTTDDIHSPRDGFWLAHMGWLLRSDKAARREALLHPPQDLINDPVLRFFEIIHFPAQLLIFGFLYAWQGWAAVCWLGCMRVVLTLHSAWCINSSGHWFGYRNHETADQSKNSKLLALLTAGEGLHNNHHLSPSSARLAHYPGEFDLGFAYIALMRSLGWVWAVHGLPVAKLNAATLTRGAPAKSNDVTTRPAASTAMSES